MPSRNRNRNRNRPQKQRRALSPARTPGAIVTRGPRDITHALRLALSSPQDERTDRASHSLTHDIHTYPARMHPATARALIELILGGTAQSGQDALFLDPFCGSGTTLVEARHRGLRVIGVDANPLAALLAQAKTWVQPAARLSKLRDSGQRIAAAALAEGKAARRSNYEAPPERVPPGIDAEERNRRLLHWYAPHVRRELEHLAGGIDRVRERDPELADVLTVILSSILYKVSRRTSDTDPTRVDRKVSRGAAARLFGERTQALVNGLRALPHARETGSLRPPGQVHVGDARSLGELVEAGSVAGIATSPPYAGTYEYADHQRLRLDFLGLPDDHFRAAEMGARGQFRGSDGQKKRRARRRYLRAMGAALQEMSRVSRPRGMIAVMLGDSVAGDRAMWAEEVMEKALPETLELLAWAGQERPKLGGRERNAFGERDKREYIFVLQKAR